MAFSIAALDAGVNSSCRSRSGPSSSSAGSIARAFTPACFKNIIDAFEGGGRAFEIGRHAQIAHAHQTHLQIGRGCPNRPPCRRFTSS